MRLLTRLPGKQVCLSPGKGKEREKKRERTGYNSRDAPECYLTNTGHGYCKTVLVVIECPWRIFIIALFPAMRVGNGMEAVDYLFKNVA